jgi:hypothetical protein
MKISTKNTMIALLAAGTLSLAIYWMASAPNRLTKAPPDIEQETDEPLKAELQEYYRTRDPRTLTVPKERMIRAKQVQDDKFAQQLFQASVPGINWTERGPSNIGGRVRALIFDLNDPSRRVWAGGVGGGLWRCNDITAASPVWTRVNDFFGNMAVTSIAQAPNTPNTLYFGTGEGFSNIDAIRGLGIWKSTDGGTTWNRLASTATSNFYYVNKIVVDNLGYVYAATLTGLLKSQDGGSTWVRVLGQPEGAPNNDAVDVEITTDQVLYCGFGTVNTSGGLFKSINRGTNWTNVTPAGSWRRTEVGVCESNANRVYVMMQSGSGNGIGGIFRSDNAGGNWTTLPNPAWCDQGFSNSDFTRGQAWYDLIIGADPTNSNNVLIGAVDIFRSTNAGASWAQVSQWASGCGSLPFVHADIHAIAYAPGTAGARVAIGHDGGVSLSNANGASGYVTKSSGLRITQYYSVAIHPNSSTNPNNLLGGTQDNGTIRTNSSGLGTGTTATGGDGGFCYIDQTNSNIQITSFPNNDYNVSTDAGATWVRRFKNSNGIFINNSDYDDRRDVLYSESAPGTLFRWINPAGNGPSLELALTNFNGARVTHVQVSANGRDSIYVGLNNGNVVRVNNASSLNGGTLLTKIIRTGTPGSVVSGIAIDPSNENHMLVTYSSYGIVSVYESFNAQTTGTPTWTAVEGNLPDMPVRWVIFDPRSTDMALIATELGVWSTDNLNGSLTDWQPTNFNLANTRVDMLQYRSSDRLLVAATHGRGLFTAVVPSTLRLAAPVASKTPMDVLNGIAVGKKVIVSGSTVSINMPPGDRYEAELIDGNGRTVAQQRFAGTTQLNTFGYAGGIYFLRLTSQGNRQRALVKVYVQ